MLSSAAAELEALGKSNGQPKPSLVAVVGGSKVSPTKPTVQNLFKIADQLVVGGGREHVHRCWRPQRVGKSLYEADLVETAQKLMKECAILIWLTLHAKAFDGNAEAEIKHVSEVQDDDMISTLAQIQLQL